MGLGDALYVQSVARHLVNKGLKLRVNSAWPDVFRPLGNKVHIAPFARSQVQILAHYSQRKKLPETTQFQDCCITAGIKEPVELKLDWKRINNKVGDELKEYERPIVCVQLPRAPMGRKDGFGSELLPDCRVIQKMIDRMCDKALIVQIGAGEALYRFKNIDVDLANKTSIPDLIDIASIADGFLGYCSFVIPLAESLDKPAMLVWSRRGLQSGHEYIRHITPKKILHKPSSGFVMDDDTDEKTDEAADAFLRSITSEASV